MIELHVEDYCHNCPDFEADVKKSFGLTMDDATLLESRVHREPKITITCEYHNRCKSIRRYLEKSIKKEN